MPRFNPVSISGYHIREAGSTAVQELAFTLADGFGYVEAALARGLDVDAFAPRLSFFFDIHNDFFEEIAKLRAARRIWARVMQERFGARKPESMRLRTHTQTAGVSATAQQPLNNVARVALQALAAVLGGAQSLHTNSYDEMLGAAHRGGGDGRPAHAADHRRGDRGAAHRRPAGRLLLPGALTDQMEAAGDGVHPRRSTSMGGMVRAIDEGYPQKEIADAAYRYQLMDDRGREDRGRREQVRDGRREGRWTTSRSTTPSSTSRSSGWGASRPARDAARVERRLKQLAEACRDGGNVMPVLVDAVKDYVSLGEISDVYRQVFGLYREPIIF